MSRQKLKLWSTHLLQDGYHHVEAWSLAGLLVHADFDQLRQVRRRAGRDLHAQTFGRDTHASFHWRQIHERNLTRHQLPDDDCEAPHVARLPVTLGTFSLQLFWWHPCGLINATALLEGEFAIAHVDASRQIFVDLKSGKIKSQNGLRYSMLTMTW